ncbi:GAF domain-containing protein [Flammeovirgaceae bacterium SG7u.111]|nr:GAF domain-containing protein [Flammeovirgaceae bacterium SG7u.132]WPO34089.1 GAF domain-containing protein [Flammeovirgaceae bacterium SG7u.111]
MGNVFFDYKASLSFRCLKEYLHNKKKEGNKSEVIVADYILREAGKSGIFEKKIEDKDIVSLDKELLDMVFSAVFSPVALEKDISAIVHPFRMEPIYTTPAWKKNFSNITNGFCIAHEDMGKMEKNKFLYANIFILENLYGLKVDFFGSKVFQFKEKSTGLNRYFKANYDSRFMNVVLKGDKPALSPEELTLLSENLTEKEIWDKYLPHGLVEFQGFMMLSLVDVTQNEVLSSLKFDLLKKDAIISREHFQRLETKLRELYSQPDLRFGIVSYSGSQVEQVTMMPQIWNSIVSEEDIKGVVCTGDVDESAFDGCIYHLMMSHNEVQVVPDLTKYEKPSPVEELLLKKGIKSVMVAPLIYDGVCLGGLELGSPHVGALSATSMIYLKEILPVFSLAAKRSLEELDNKVQAVIKEEYTAIHPAVEWRFAQAALNKINKDRVNGGRLTEGEKIVFDEVHPLYGQTDVRGSSTERNKAIQADLTEQLTLARNVLNTIDGKENLNLIDEVIFRIDECIASISTGMGSGDELTILQFISNEVEDLLNHFRVSGQLSVENYNRYFNALDPKLGLVYKKRKAFEDSLTAINDAVSQYIEEQQVDIQKAFPHYFEKYKTDGVEYNIYIGDTIVPDRKYNDVYLQNLRLWQLKMTAEIAQLANQLKPNLPLPLSATHLILVNNAPISIRFREDEKQFDVDGAYNIRYEIVKKRIDKAHIKNTEERLTQPDMIAIVYTHDSEANEFIRYIRFLQKQGLLEEGIEFLELESLQGVSGLKALRVKVKVQKDVETAINTPKVINKLLEEV